MNLRHIPTLLACVALLGALVASLAPQPATGARLAADGTCVVTLTVNGQAVDYPFATLYPSVPPPASCAAPTATAIPPTATHTHTPAPTATGTPAPAGWHAPGRHDGLNVHEHGRATPPGWTYGTNCGDPFSQTRESHTGYKGVYADSPGGAESYLITHILATEGARAHGDHDGMLFLRSPITGEVLCFTGVLDFGDPPPLRTADTGERPIILSVGDGGCETWYGFDLGRRLVDIGWTICGRYQNFAGDVLGGDGSFRTVDWIVPCDRLPATSSLRQHCRTEFGVSRLSFIENSVENDPQHIVRPIN